MLGQAKAVGGGGMGQGVEVRDGAGREAPVLYRGPKRGKGHFLATGCHKTKPLAMAGSVRAPSTLKYEGTSDGFCWSRLLVMWTVTASMDGSGRA